MKTRVTMIALFAVLSSPLVGFAAPDADDLQKSATELFASFSPEQRKQALLPLDSKVRDEEQFTGGKRAGIALGKLEPKQRELAMSLIKGFASEYGAAKCEQIAQEDADEGGMDKYFVVFFGEPGPGKTYAWRIAEHHLTLVHVEVEDGKAARFGPILLGSDPPTLFDDEEDVMIALWGALSPAEREKVTRKGRGVSTGAIGEAGAKVSELSPTAQEKVKAVYENRLKFFAPAIAQRVRAIVDGAGGLGAMQVAFFGDVNKRCRDGGRWDFKLGGATFLCDYEGSRGHIHLSMKGELKAK